MSGTTGAANDSLTEDELIAGFEAADLAAFHHRDHVRVAWIYLRRLGLHGALAAVSQGLRRMSAARGQSAKYHETVSWLYVFVIHERLARGRTADLEAAAAWDAFVEANPDLFGDWGAFAKRFYTEQTLDSAIARGVFVLPDRIGGGAAPAVER